MLLCLSYLHYVIDSGDGHKQSDVSSLYVWLRPNLRVRIIDENYRHGKYYNMKVKYSF